MNKRIFLFSWLMMTVFTASAQVQTTSGLVSGTDQEGSMAFLGIPYAKIERFMPPLPVEKWQGVTSSFLCSKRG